MKKYRRLNKEYHSNKRKNMSKPFYVISSLGSARSFQELPDRVKHDTEASAIESAKSILESRQLKGDREISFYILKAVAIVGTEHPPIEVTKLK